MKTLICAHFIAGALLFAADTGAPKTFATPDEAAQALVKAASGGMDQLRDFLGGSAADVLRSGDPVEDNNRLAEFNRRVAEKTKLESDDLDPDRIIFVIGNEEWPFAIPLLRKNGQWHWDIQEGKAEVRHRVIGGNELDAIEVCRGFVEAEQMYAETDWDGNGVLEYARKLVSTEGKKDGLYWPGEDSPVAEGIAKAAAEGYSAPGSNKGYHGYRFKILLSQGPDARDGAEDYIAHGFMIGGFALVAWPVEYGVSGIMSFIVNQDGIVYEKDLGSQTASVAAAMTKYNPDKTWRISPE